MPLPSDRLRIALIAAPSQMGGLETVLSELLAASQDSSIECTCFALLSEALPVPTPLAAAAEGGARIVRVAAPHRAYHRHYRSLLKQLRAYRPRLIHSHGYHADVLSSLLARALGVPHVSTLHGFVGGSRRGRFYEWMQLQSLRRAAAVVAVSAQVAQRAVAQGVAAQRVHQLPNSAPEGVVLSRSAARAALGVAHDGPLIGWIGRMSAEKDPLGFVAVMNALQQCSKAVTGIMIGDGELLEEVRVIGAPLIDAGRLRATGAMPGAGRLLAAFDVLLLTSSTEGTPMVALEAMRAGVPVASTSVGGVPAMLDDECGLLVPYGDTAAMQRAVESVLHDPPFAARMASNARARVQERYSRDAWWTAHIRLYERLLNS